MTFVSPLPRYYEDRRYDLDMASYSLVKSYHDRTGTTYPDMPWDAKQSFQAVARHFANVRRPGNPRSCWVRGPVRLRRDFQAG